MTHRQRNCAAVLLLALIPIALWSVHAGWGLFVPTNLAPPHARETFEKAVRLAEEAEAQRAQEQAHEEDAPTDLPRSVPQ